MRFSIFENDGTLGRSPLDPPQLPPIDGDCSCVHGTPYRDENGNCRCSNDLPQLGNYGGPRTMVEHAYVTTVLPGESAPAAQYNKAAADDGTLFGLSPLMLLLIAGGGLWALTSFGGSTKKKGGEY